MSTYLKISFFILVSVLISVQIQAQTSFLPKVFFLGEHETDFQKLDQECSDILLTVCKDSMDVAYENWLGFLTDIETYAEEVDFDIKGAKLWLKVFWQADGTIRHIAYYPKPNCRNMDFEKLTEFFERFTVSYTFSISNDTCFSHYSSANFPTFSQLYRRLEK